MTNLKKKIQLIKKNQMNKKNDNFEIVKKEKVTYFAAVIKSGFHRTESSSTSPETTGSPITFCPILQNKF